MSKTKDMRNIIEGLDITLGTRFVNEEPVAEMPMDDYSDRQEMTTHNGVVSVDITDPEMEGNLMTDIPSISIEVNGKLAILLTWEEAYELAAMVKDVTERSDRG